MVARLFEMHSPRSPLGSSSGSLRRGNSNLGSPAQRSPTHCSPGTARDVLDHNGKVSPSKYSPGAKPQACSQLGAPRPSVQRSPAAAGSHPAQLRRCPATQRIPTMTTSVATPRSAEVLPRAGTRVAVAGIGNGTVRFVGETRFKPGMWVGVELDEADGRNDGSVQGVRYFSCAPARGIFVLPPSVQLIEGDGDRAGGACEVVPRRTAPSLEGAAGKDLQAIGLSRNASCIKPVSSMLCDTSLCVTRELLSASTAAQSQRQESEVAEIAQDSWDGAASVDCGPRHKASRELHDVYCADWSKPELFSGSVSASESSLTSSSGAASHVVAVEEFSIDVDEEQRLLMAALDGMRAAAEDATQRAERAEARLVCGDLQMHLKACLAREVREAVQSIVVEATSELRAAAAEIRHLRAEATSSSASALVGASVLPSEVADAEPCPRLEVAADSETMLAVKVAAQQALANTRAPKDHNSMPKSVNETGSTATPTESAGASAGCRSEGGSGNTSGDTSPKQIVSPKQASSDESNDSSDTILLAPTAPWPRWEETHLQTLTPSAVAAPAELVVPQQLQPRPLREVAASPPRQAQDEPSPDAQQSPARPQAPVAGKLPVCKPMAMQRVRATVQPLIEIPPSQSMQNVESPRLADAVESGEPRRVKDVVSEWEKILPLRPATPTGGTPLAAWPFGTAAQRGSIVLAPPLKPHWSKRAASLAARTSAPTSTSATAKIVADTGLRPEWLAERQVSR